VVGVIKIVTPRSADQPAVVLNFLVGRTLLGTTVAEVFHGVFTFVAHLIAIAILVSGPQIILWCHQDGI